MDLFGTRPIERITVGPLYKICTPLLYAGFDKNHMQGRTKVSMPRSFIGKDSQ